MQVLSAAFLAGLLACVHGTVLMSLDEDADFEENVERWEADIDNTANGGMEGLHFGLQKDPCCVPAQWEGGASESIESITFPPHPHEENEIDRRRPRPRPRPRMDESFVLMDLHVDFTNQRVAVEEHVFSRQGNTNVSVIIDGKTHVMYAIFPNRKSCTKMPFAGNLTGQCLPPTSKFIGSATFGLGDNSLNYDAFGFRARTREMSVGAMAVVTSDSCAPISEVGKGRTGRTFFKFSAGFFNLKAGIKDTKVFTPPEYCQTQKEEAFQVDSHPILRFASRSFLL